MIALAGTDDLLPGRTSLSPAGALPAEETTAAGEGTDNETPLTPPEVRILRSPPRHEPPQDPRFSEADRAAMAEALQLAGLARGHTHPNPMVGCVIVKDGIVVGRGYHQRAGEPHAEVFALCEAGQRARAATVYVTLEPCAHYGRTPPCADSLVGAGVGRVVAAMRDPDPRVMGRGLLRLREHGIQVQEGLMEEEARELNRAWLHFARTGRPLVLMKAATTLDGKIACASGDSRWVTGPQARAHAHELRDRCDAIVVGITTVITDDPMLTTRLARPGTRDPLRVVLDSSARTPLQAKVLRPQALQRAGTVIVTTDQASASRIRELEAAGARVLTLPSDQDGLAPLPELLSALGQEGIRSVLVEGGGQVHWSFLKQGLVDRIYMYVAPKLIGGFRAPGPVGGPGLERMVDAWRLRELKVSQLGQDILIEGDALR